MLLCFCLQLNLEAILSNKSKLKVSSICFYLLAGNWKTLEHKKRQLRIKDAFCCLRTNLFYWIVSWVMVLKLNINFNNKMSHFNSLEIVVHSNSFVTHMLGLVFFCSLQPLFVVTVKIHLLHWLFGTIIMLHLHYSLQPDNLLT